MFILIFTGLVWAGDHGVQRHVNLEYRSLFDAQVSTVDRPSLAQLRNRTDTEVLSNSKAWVCDSHNILHNLHRERIEALKKDTNKTYIDHCKVDAKNRLEDGMRKTRFDLIDDAAYLCPFSQPSIEAHSKMMFRFMDKGQWALASIHASSLREQSKELTPAQARAVSYVYQMTGQEDGQMSSVPSGALAEGFWKAVISPDPEVRKEAARALRHLSANELKRHFGGQDRTESAPCVLPKISAMDFQSESDQNELVNFLIEFDVIQEPVRRLLEEALLKPLSSTIQEKYLSHLRRFGLPDERVWKLLVSLNGAGPLKELAENLLIRLDPTSPKVAQLIIDEGRTSYIMSERLAHHFAPALQAHSQALVKSFLEAENWHPAFAVIYAGGPSAIEDITPIVTAFDKMDKDHRANVIPLLSKWIGSSDRVLNKFISILNDDSQDIQTQVRVGQSFGSLGPEKIKKALPGLIKLIERRGPQKSSDLSMVFMTIGKLEIEGQAAGPVIEKVLDLLSKTDRKFAYMALDRIKHKNSALIKTIIENFKSKPSSVGLELNYAGAMDPKGLQDALFGLLSREVRPDLPSLSPILRTHPSMAGVFAEWLDSKELQLKDHLFIMSALVEAAPETAIPILQKWLNRDDLYMAAAVGHLGELKSDVARDKILSLVNGQFKTEAIPALAKIGDPRDLPILERVLDEDKYGYYTDLILKAFGSSKFPVEKTVPRLISALRTDRWGTAMGSLKKLGPTAKAAAPELRELIQNSTGSMQGRYQEALNTLAIIDPSSEATRALFLRAQTNDNLEMRIAARNALDEFDRPVGVAPKKTMQDPH